MTLGPPQEGVGEVGVASRQLLGAAAGRGDAAGDDAVFVLGRAEPFAPHPQGQPQVRQAGGELVVVGRRKGDCAVENRDGAV